MSVISTETYLIKHINGSFKLFLSQHDNGYYYGGILYYLKSGSFSNDDLILNFKLETLYEKDKNKLYLNSLEWIKNNIKGEFEIEKLNNNNM